MTNPSPWTLDDGAALLVVTRYRVPNERRVDFIADAGRAIAVLAGQHGCRSASLGQATDEIDLFVIRSEWVHVGAYRRALSSFDVKMNAIPLLSSAIDESSAFEIVDHWTPEGRTTAPSGLAADADSVGLGSAAAASVPPVST